MKISEIWIYPVKSLGGIRREDHEMLKTGLRWDRQWMVVDENGKFVTQREKPQMAGVKMDVRGDQIWMQTGAVWEKLKGASSDQKQVQVWNSSVRGAVDGNPKLSEFLSDLLGMRASLVTMAPGAERRIFEKDVDVGRGTYFADSHPILFASEKTLAELNSRLKEPIPVNRFRPNLVIAGAERPDDEEAWEKIRAGKLEIELRKRCSRCPITTIDQETGVKKGHEPLATLAKYKRDGTRIFFGVYGWSENEDRICVGDPVQILSAKTG